MAEFPFLTTDNLNGERKILLFVQRILSFIVQQSFSWQIFKNIVTSNLRAEVVTLGYQFPTRFVKLS